MFFKKTLLLSLLLAGCSPTLYKPTALDSPWLEKNAPNATLEKINFGRATYIQRCGECHRLRKPEKFEPIKWEKVVAKMEKKFVLFPEDRESILLYLSTVGELQRFKKANQLR